MNPSNQPTHDFKGVPASFDIRPPSRREFLQRFAGGIMVWIVASDLAFAADSEAARPIPTRQTVPTDFNAFLRIGEDGRVTCLTGKIEMGQGPVTSLPQMLAEDLDVPVDSIDIIMGDTELCPYDAGTWGSLTTREFGPKMRAAATEAKGVLLELASEALAVPVAQLVAEQGVISVKGSPEKKVTYGELTKGKRIERRLSAKPELKPASQFKVVGKPMLRRDARDKVTGKTQFTGDLRLPGMLYARVVRPPAHGAVLKSIDLSAAKAIAGVVVVDEVVDGRKFAAVLHQLPDVAEAALGEVKTVVEPSPSKLNDRNIHEHLEKSTVAPRVMPGAKGDIEEGRKLATRTLDATYLDNYIAHSAMETHTALARIEGDKATVWASTQNPFGARNEIARALGFPPANVRVITPFVGGGFGGKAANFQAVEAARLAKFTGRPVLVMWTREEEFFMDTFRPAAVVNISSGLDGSGKVTFFDYTVRFAGDRGSTLHYAFPNSRVRSVGNFNGPPGVHPFEVGAWRAPGCNTNTFAREAHIERLAALAGVDPIEFRLSQMADQQQARVLRAVAEMVDWKPAKGPSGRGYGIACGSDAGSYVATIAEVEVNKSTGEVKVKRVSCAQEMGVVVNPQGAKLQMEGCIMMGMGYALSEEVRFENGEIKDLNFDSYTIPRFSWIPKIQTKILEANDRPAQGGGEPAIIVMGGAIANAIFDATGAQLNQMPMTPARVKAALARV